MHAHRQSTLGTVERHATDTRAEMLVTKGFWTTSRPVPSQATGSWVLRRRRTL